MVKTKELIICIISIIALVLAITTNVFATQTSDVGVLLGNNIEKNADNNFSEIPSTTTDKDNTTKTTNTNNTTNRNNTTNTMPNTGVSYSSVVIIAVAGVSAVYAYKKIRDYNV